MSFSSAHSILTVWVHGSCRLTLISQRNSSSASEMVMVSEIEILDLKVTDKDFINLFLEMHLREGPFKGHSKHERVFRGSKLPAVKRE